MSYPPHHLSNTAMHHPLELERRLTKLEDAAEHHGELHDEHREAAGKLQGRMNWHERCIVTIVGVLQILLQDKYPALVKILKGLGP